MKKEIGALISIALLLFLGFLFPITLALGNQEISNPDVSFNLFLFSIMLAIGLFGIGIVYFARYLWRKDNKYGDGFGFYNLGDKPALSFFGRFSPLQLTLLAIMLFSVTFLFSNLLQISGFTSSKVLPQQFSPVESILFSTFLVSTGEEAMSIFLSGLLVLALVLIAIKFNLSYREFRTYYFIGIPLIIAVFAVIWHNNAYVNSEISLAIVFFFWLAKEVFSLATGLIFIRVIIHSFNNFFIDFVRIYSSDLYFAIMIGVIFLTGIIYFYLYRKKGAWYKGVNKVKNAKSQI